MRGLFGLGWAAEQRAQDIRVCLPRSPLCLPRLDPSSMPCPLPRNLQPREEPELVAAVAAVSNGAYTNGTNGSRPADGRKGKKGKKNGL